MNAAKQIRYFGDAIQGYPVSLWTDGLIRITSPHTGKTVRTFTSAKELADYRLFLVIKAKATT